MSICCNACFAFQDTFSLMFCCYVFLAGHRVLQQSRTAVMRHWGSAHVLWDMSCVCYSIATRRARRIHHPPCPHSCSGEWRLPHSCTAFSSYLTFQLLSLCLELTAQSMPWQCLQYADEARDCPDAAISRASLSPFLSQFIPVREASLSPITTPGSSTAPAEEVERLEPAILTSADYAQKAAPSSACCRTSLLRVNCVTLLWRWCCLLLTMSMTIMTRMTRLGRPLQSQCRPVE